MTAYSKAASRESVQNITERCRKVACCLNQVSCRLAHDFSVSFILTRTIMFLCSLQPPWSNFLELDAPKEVSIVSVFHVDQVKQAARELIVIPNEWAQSYLHVELFRDINKFELSLDAVLKTLRLFLTLLRGTKGDSLWFICLCEHKLIFNIAV